ncbi:MAG: hypothetical protein V2I97_01460 [Desulfococcaceae bacterium]|jgi:hypothetical protein|nr:hypothetical protein [Desulfococcaceae bacterium]
MILSSCKFCIIVFRIKGLSEPGFSGFMDVPGFFCSHAERSAKIKAKAGFSQNCPRGTEENSPAVYFRKICPEHDDTGLFRTDMILSSCKFCIILHNPVQDKRSAKIKAKAGFSQNCPGGQKRIARQFTAGKSVLNTMIQDYSGWA